MNNKFAERKYVIQGIFIALGILFLFRLFYLQIIDEDLKIAAMNNTTRPITEYAKRGVIYDRNGIPLVFNQVAYDLNVDIKEIKEIDTLELCEILKISEEEFIERMKKVSFADPSFLKQINPETYAALEEKAYKFPGFYFQKRTIRKYPKPIAAHVLGYVSEVSDHDRLKNSYYKPRDDIGKNGLEKYYEAELRGQKGVRKMMVNRFNRIIGSYKEGMYDTTAVDGLPMMITLDADLQEYGEKLMQNKKGSIVAIEPSTGEILVLVSSPAYDPNLLVGRKLSETYKMLSKDENKPLINRATLGQYPPGSTFKLINALIGLQEEVITPETRYSCAMGYSVGNFHMGCHQHFSPLDLRQAVQHSCNAYFASTFRAIIDKGSASTETRFDKWRDYVVSFGLGSRLPSDYLNQETGYVPTTKYYDKYHGKGYWKSLTIVSLAIGQGEMSVTPLQLSNITASIANRGYYITPHLVKMINDTAIENSEFHQKHIISIDTENFEVIIDGMHQVVESGTGAGGKIKDIPFCGKTGTAQNPHGKDHSIYIAFAPKNDPKIAIAVVVENAGFGATYAVPLASLLIEKYLNDTITRPHLEERLLNANLLNSEETAGDIQQH
jgi:penicillin-binding protein 2